MTLKEAALYIRNHCNPALDDKTEWEKATFLAIRSLQAWEKIKTQIREEIESAYADFEQYKMDYLGCEDVDDDPLDFFHCGLERTIEIINKYLPEVEG